MAYTIDTSKPIFIPQNINKSRSKLSNKDENNNAIVNAKVLTEDANGNMIRSKAGKVVVVDGLSDYIIVDKDEVLLIYPKTKEQDIKQVLNKVKDTFGDEFA